jgi:hypothetical protein
MLLLVPIELQSPISVSSNTFPNHLGFLLKYCLFISVFNNYLLSSCCMQAWVWVLGEVTSKYTLYLFL